MPRRSSSPTREGLAQGTIYPDVVESASVNGPAAKIKSHHNGADCPRAHAPESRRTAAPAFQGRVRRVGRSLGIGEELIGRHPFREPGLAIRILGEITPERRDPANKWTDLHRRPCAARALRAVSGQAGVILLPVKSVGVMGDERTYELCGAARQVASTDGMTAIWRAPALRIPGRVSGDIINRFAASTASSRHLLQTARNDRVG